MKINLFRSNIRREGFAEVMKLPISVTPSVQNNASIAANYEDHINMNKNICETELKIQNASVNAVLLSKSYTCS